MTTSLPKGSIVALVTPFCEDGSVNTEKLRELVEFHVSHDTDGILVLGTTGESSTMTEEEDDLAAKTVIEAAAGRIPVIVGAGSNNTATQLDKAKKYEKMGADGLLLISPLLQQSQYRRAGPPLHHSGGYGEHPHHPLQHPRPHRHVHSGGSG